MTIVDNIINVKQRINNVCQRIGRDPGEIKLIAVSKTVPAEAIKIAVENGIDHIGENRVQEAEKKFEQLGNIATWHLVGHLQTNKVKKALLIFHFIHSVDSFHLAQEISKRALLLQQEFDCLVEVNTSGEDTKFGVSPDETHQLIQKIAPFPGIRIKGLMTIGAFLPDPEDVRPCFKMLRELRDEIDKAGLENVDMKYLSMGMTDDFEVALEEGANMIRIGRAIFGERD